MSHHKTFKNESQDARRHDQHNAVHSDSKHPKNKSKSEQHHNKRK